MSPRLGAIVLAAGRSARMGTRSSKLVEMLGGRPLLAAPIDALLELGAHPVLCVTGHDAAGVAHALGDRAIEWVHNEEWAEGMGRSIARGAEAIEGRGCDGVFVCPGDLPGLRSAMLAPLVEAFEAGRAESICVPVHGGRRGHPVLFPARLLPSLRRLRGDRGARGVLETHATELVEVELASAAIHADVDTPGALERARRRLAD